MAFLRMGTQPFERDIFRLSLCNGLWNAGSPAIDHVSLECIGNADYVGHAITLFEPIVGFTGDVPPDVEIGWSALPALSR